MKKGFTMIDNNVYKYIVGADLTCTELKILLVIIHYTKGYSRDECVLTTSYISKITNKAVRSVRYALKELCEKGLITKSQSENNQVITYALGDLEGATDCSGDVRSFAQVGVQSDVHKGVQSVAYNKYNNINKKNYINNGSKNVFTTPKATKFSNFESGHIIDYKKLELEALRRRIERNRKESS